MRFRFVFPNKYILFHLQNKTIEERNRVYIIMSCSLWDHDDKHGPDANVNHTMMAIQVAALLELTNQKDRIPNSQDLTTNQSDASQVDYLDSANHKQAYLDQDFFVQFAALLVVDIRRIVFNVSGWTDWNIDKYVTNCQCLVGSLINHSCVPNTRWEWSDGVICFTIKHAIEADQEVTISYGPSKSGQYFDLQKVYIVLRGTH